MALSPAARQIVDAWVAQKVSGCPLCGSSQWAVGDLMVLFSVPNFVPGPPPPFQHGPAFGAVRLSCQSCGYVALLEAERMGLFAPPKP